MNEDSRDNHETFAEYRESINGSNSNHCLLQNTHINYSSCGNGVVLI